jgi:hypothetical protein
MPTVVDELVIKLGLDSRGFQADAERTQTAVGRTGRVARRESSELEEALRKSQKQTDLRLKQTEEVGEKTGKSFHRVVKEVSALFGVLATGYGLQQFIKNLTGTEAATGRLAKNIGMSTNELNTWQEAAKRFGGTAEETGGSFLGLANEMERIALTGQSEIRPYFLTLGVALADTTGKARPLRDIMLDLSEKFKTMTPQRANFFGHAIGLDQGTITLLREGRDGVAAVLEEVSKIGAMTDRQSEEAIKFERLMAGLEQSFNNLKRILLSELLPSINDAVVGLSKLLEEPETKKQIIETLHEMGDGVREFAKFANEAAEAVGGWKNATEILFALWIGAKFVRFLANVKTLLSLFSIGGGAAAAGGGAAAGGLGALLARLLPPALGAYLGFSVGSNPLATDEQEREAMSHEGEAPRPLPRQGRTLMDWLGGLGGWSGATVPSPGDPSSPRGIRNNNPLNLSYMPGQIGVLGREQGNNQQFGVYPDMETGIAANMRQLLRYQDNYGLKTVRQLVEKWTSEPGVDHSKYIDDVAHALGVGPDTAIVDLHQQRMAEAYIQAAARHESGAVSAEAVTRGVARALGNTETTNVARGGSAPALGTPALDPGMRSGLRQPARAMLSSNGGGGGTVSNVVSVGTVIVNTKATDANGIGRDIAGALKKYAYANQANTGLA